jgi:undecaprenyl-diphosphatase
MTPRLPRSGALRTLLRRDSEVSPDLRRRLLLGALAGFLIAVPLTLLVVWVRDGWGPLRRVDLGTADALHGWVAGHPAVVTALNVIATVLHPWVFRAGIAALVVVLWRRGALRLAWWAGVTMLAGSLLGSLLKLVFARARPRFDAPVGLAPGFSFPSGHALNSTVATLVVLLVVLPALPAGRARLAAWAAGLALVLLVGFDRVALGVHYVSDVVGGWLIATALVAATAAAFETWRRERGRPPANPMEGVEPEESRRLA